MTRCCNTHFGPIVREVRGQESFLSELPLKNEWYHRTHRTIIFVRYESRASQF